MVPSKSIYSISDTAYISFRLSASLDEWAAFTGKETFDVPEEFGNNRGNIKIFRLIPEKQMIFRVWCNISWVVKTELVSGIENPLCQ
jgi:hypothetical protein